MTLAALFLFSSCGFALRGSAPDDAQAGTVFFDAAEPGSAFAQTLRDALIAANVPMSTSASDDTYHLQIGPESMISRPGSVNSRARAAQYDVELSVEILLEYQGSVTFGPQRVATQRSYYEDLSTISGSNEEVALLQQEMRHDLAQQLLRRLRAATSGPGA